MKTFLIFMLFISINAYGKNKERKKIIVKYRESVSKAYSLHQASSIAKGRVPKIKNKVYHLELSNDENISHVIKAFKSDPDVLYAEEDKIMQYQGVFPSDPLFSQQWNLENPYYGLELSQAWEETKGSEEMIVAVIDTGIIEHPDLNGRLLAGADFVSDVYMANDGDSRDLNPSDPGDWVSSEDFCYYGVSRNSSWHGTHVAGIIGANSNNSIGGAGINWNSKILPVRVLGKCGGYTSDIVDGMKWAAGIQVDGMPVNKNPAKVLNLSLGAAGNCSSYMQEAINQIRALGVIIVVAAGNSNLNLDMLSFTPANCQGVITVGATDKIGRKASYSNFGPQVTISAPGGDNYDGIYSLGNLGVQGPAEHTFTVMSGTSMAAPHVSGVVSLMLSVNPNLVVSQVVDILRSSASSFDSFSSCNESICGAGMLNAYEAIITSQSTDTDGVVDDYNPVEVRDNNSPHIYQVQNDDGGTCGTITSIDNSGGNSWRLSLLIVPFLLGAMSLIRSEKSKKGPL